MKGVLFLHLRRFVEEAYPQIRWDDILSECGLVQLFTDGWDYPDEVMFCLVGNACRLLHVSPAEFWYRFGKYSMRQFHKDAHWYFTQAPNARAFLLSINEVHADAVAHLPRARPPQFEARLGDAGGELVLKYRSPRRMLAYLRGAIDGVLELYGETAEVRIVRQDDDEVTIRLYF